MTNLEMATEIADAASYLDFLKRSHSQETIAEASKHVENLHTIAAYLAAGRIEQLYLTDYPDHTSH